MTRGTRLASFLAGLLLWELVARYVVQNNLFLVPFSTTMLEIVDLVTEGPLLGHLWTSLQELVIGYGLAVVIGIVVGTAMGLSRTVRTSTSFWVDIFNATPIIALAPVFILMLGLGLASKVALVAFIAVWTVTINTAAGFLAIDEELVEMVSSFGATPRQVFTSVRVPMAVPYIVVGLRIGIGRAIVGVVVGELFGATSGLGYFLFQSKDRFDTPGIYAAIVVLAVVALAAVRALEFVERQFPWGPGTTT